MYGYSIHSGQAIYRERTLDIIWFYQCFLPSHPKFTHCHILVVHSPISLLCFVVSSIRVFPTVNYCWLSNRLSLHTVKSPSNYEVWPWKRCICGNGCVVAENAYNRIITRIAVMHCEFFKLKQIRSVLNAYLLVDYYYYAIICP